MKNILTIDFDIIMHPSIDLYNDYDDDVDAFLLKFDFIPTLEADLRLYRDLTKIVTHYKDQLTFIYDHHDIVDYIKDEDKIDLYNIDYHHDVGYIDDEGKWHIPLTEEDYHEGNWVRYLYNIDKINSYTWFKSWNSIPPAKEGEKYITNTHIIHSLDMTHFTEDLQFDHIYICLSSPWIPEYYTHLYYIWEDLTNNE